MLASSNILPALNVDVETSHTVMNADSDMLSASSPKCHSLGSNSLHQPRSRNAHHNYRGGRKVPPKSPDLIELSDAGQSPVSVCACILLPHLSTFFIVCCDFV